MASGIAQLEALRANADAHQQLSDAVSNSLNHPNDQAAEERLIGARMNAQRAQTASDRTQCRNKEALATRMRNASVREQNYLMTLCGR